MSQVEFDEFKADDIRRPRGAESFITNLIIKTGLAKDKESANKVMIIISVVCIIIAIYFAVK